MPFFKQKEEQLDASAEAKKERSYLWMARVFCLVCVVTLLTDFILLAAVKSLLPLVRVQPFYITTQDKDKQIVKIIRPPQSTLSSDVLQQSFVRQYLLARYLIGTDVAELNRRWGRDGTIQWMSSPLEFEKFNRRAEGLFRLVDEDGLTQDVDILNVRQIPRNGQIIWEATIRLTEMRRTVPAPRSNDWLIQMRIEFGNFREGLTWEERLKNPLGFQVVDFSEQDLSIRDLEGNKKNEKK